MRILIVEDDPTTLAVVKQALGKTGNEIDTALDGIAALVLASGSKYDLLILDRMLPSHDGLELLKELRVTQASAAALFCTTSVSALSFTTDHGSTA